MKDMVIPGDYFPFRRIESRWGDLVKSGLVLIIFYSDQKEKQIWEVEWQVI